MTGSASWHVRIIPIAVALAVVALWGRAQAEIVFHPADIGISFGTYNLDLNSDGITDFTIASAAGGRCSFFNQHTQVLLTETPASGNGAIVGPLNLGDEIGPNQTFDASDAVMSGHDINYDSQTRKCVTRAGFGPWLGKKGYLGLSLQVNGQTYFGWALLRSPISGGRGTLLGYAYETIPGRAILAGETTYIWFTPALLNFGRVPLGDTASASATLTNLGPHTVLISNATIGGNNSSDFASKNGDPPCGGSVAAGATCTLKFTFTPSVTGKEVANYLVYDNTGGSPQELKLVGTGQ